MACPNKPCSLRRNGFGAHSHFAGGLNTITVVICSEIACLKPHTTTAAVSCLSCTMNTENQTPATSQACTMRMPRKLMLSLHGPKKKHLYKPRHAESTDSAVSACQSRTGNNPAATMEAATLQADAAAASAPLAAAAETTSAAAPGAEVSDDDLAALLLGGSVSRGVCWDAAPVESTGAQWDTLMQDADGADELERMWWDRMQQPAEGIGGDSSFLDETQQQKEQRKQHRKRSRDTTVTDEYFEDDDFNGVYLAEPHEIKAAKALAKASLAAAAARLEAAKAASADASKRKAAAGATAVAQAPLHAAYLHDSSSSSSSSSSSPEPAAKKRRACGSDSSVEGQPLSHAGVPVAGQPGEPCAAVQVTTPAAAEATGRWLGKPCLQLGDAADSEPGHQQLFKVGLLRVGRSVSPAPATPVMPGSAVSQAGSSGAATTGCSSPCSARRIRFLDEWGGELGSPRLFLKRDPPCLVSLPPGTA